jgi:DNA (cytosine-5)-methyltransferase 1
MGAGLVADLRALELFAGAGGAALGLHRAGFEHALMVERDEHAAATLTAANLGPVECADVRHVDYSAHRGIELMWASPPCQCWSSAGKRLGASDTERNGWPWTWEIVDQAAPRWLVCENVPGLLHHSAEYHPDPMRCAGCYWERVILPAARARFRWVDVWKLNAADYGVPQMRRRVFLVCGDRRVSQPPPTHGDPATLSPLFDQRQPWRTVGQALGLQVYSAGGSMVALMERASGARPPTFRSLDSPSPTVQGGPAGGFDRLSVVALLERPAPTICGVDGVGLGGAHARNQCESFTGRRRLTTDECATLQAFPEDHPWRGSTTAVYRQIGNAVPPPVAEAIGRQISAAISSSGASCGAR